MLKFNKFVLSVFLLFLHSEIQAVGGQDVEIVSTAECYQKGIVRLYSSNRKLNGSGVLFKEGNGYLGLTAKHVAQKFLNVKANVDLGNGHQSEIITFYTHKDVDLALFVLKEPVNEFKDFFELPKSSALNSVMIGNVYGFGAATSKDHPGTLENSNDKLCRKGEIFLAPINQLKSTDINLLLLDETVLKNNSLISYSMPLKDKFIEDEELKTLNQEGLFLENNEILNKSSSFLLSGDSGGPIIQDNEIMGISASGIPHIMLHCAFGENRPDGEGYKSIGSILLNNKQKYYDTMIYFHDKIGFYWWFISSDLSQNTFNQLSLICADIIGNEYQDFYLNGYSTYLHDFIKKSPQKEIEHLEKTFRLAVSCVTPTQNHLDWIETMSKIALSANAKITEEMN